MLFHLLFSMLGGAEWIIILLVASGGLIFWIKMIAEVASSDFDNQDSKITWLLVTILLGFLGALIYYFAGRNGRIPKTV